MIVRDDHGVPDGYGSVAYGGLFDSIKRAARAVGSAVSAVIPDKVERLVKDAAASSAVMLTGGAALLIPGVREPAIEGFKIGAVAGAALSGSAALAKGAKLATNTTGPQSTAPAGTGSPYGAEPAAAAPGGAAPAVLGAGAGFLAAGPVGALIGAVAGYALSRKG
jgi:hypothetical protein